MAKSGQSLLAIGFIMPQVYAVSDIKRYVVSVDKVEEVTGIDFFPAVPKETQEKIEAFGDIGIWQ